MHNEMLQVEGKKMSKSLGNFFSVRELLDQGYSGEVIRFVYLSTHYSKPMDWTNKKAEEAATILRKWRMITDDVISSNSVSPTIINALEDDLNTAGAITALHNLAKRGDAALLKSSAALLGLLGDDMGNWVKVIDFDLSALEAMISTERDKAMKNNDFSKVDYLKRTFVSAGLDVQMSKKDITLIAGPKFNSSLLEGLL
jgi:cysteinyl-tRNA synthetase